MFCRSLLQALIMMAKLQNDILMLYSIFTIPLGTCKEACRLIEQGVTVFT